MSDFIIATSSTCDLPRTWLDEHNVPFISYSFTINDQPAVDDCREESRAQIYAGMRKGDILKTSQINEPAYEEFSGSSFQKARMFFSLTCRKKCLSLLSIARPQLKSSGLNSRTGSFM